MTVRGRRRTRATAAAPVRHAVAGRRRVAAVVGAVDERDVVLIEAERAAHEPVETEHVARQLHHARKFSTTSARARAPNAIISLLPAPSHVRTLPPKFAGRENVCERSAIS